MPDYELNEKVECARHALALDDQRDAFQPLLWDELAEERRADEAANALAVLRQRAELHRDAGALEESEKLLAHAAEVQARAKHFRSRMQQVWFTGMHADVGGGYPDESLSYVSLLWMMEEAEQAGLRTLDSIKNRYFALANSYGPMHDSRSGLGAYYRYQPRKIAAWLDPPEKRHLMLRDPDIRDQETKAEHGLLRQVRVHESVIARIDTGTVRYAPISLPCRFAVVPPQREGEKIEQPNSEEDDGKTGEVTPPSEPLIGTEVRARLAASAESRFACQENLWDLVWWRRVAYFATLAVTLMLVALPWWNPLFFVEQTCSDARCVLPSLIRSANVLVPGFAEGWIEAVADYPVTAIILVLAIWRLLRWGGSIECRLYDRSYRLWRAALDGEAIAAERCRPSGLRAFREGEGYQKLFRRLKWFWLPALFGLLMASVILYVPLVGLTQASIQLEEPAHFFCAEQQPAGLHALGRAEFMFDTRSRCVSPGLKVKEGQVYEIVFQLPLQDNGEPAPWWDKGRASSPGSLTRVRASGFWQFLGMPMRRVIEASYLQPLAQIAAMDEAAAPVPPSRGVAAKRWLPHFDRINVSKLDLTADADWPELYRTRFKAPLSGSLHLYANDAQLPFGWGRGFYRNNCGVARVTVTHILPRRKGVPPQPLIGEPGDPLPLPDCARKRLAGKH
jgi:hypothetical protein